MIEEDLFLAKDCQPHSPSAVDRRSADPALGLSPSHRSRRGCTPLPAGPSMNSNSGRYNFEGNRIRPLDPSRSHNPQLEASLKAASSHLNRDLTRRQLTNNPDERLEHLNPYKRLAPLQIQKSVSMASNIHQHQYFPMEDYIDFTLYDGDKDSFFYTPTSLLSHQAEAALQGSPEETHRLFSPSYPLPPSAFSGPYQHPQPSHDHHGQVSFDPTYFDEPRSTSLVDQPPIPTSSPPRPVSNQSTAPPSPQTLLDYGILQSSGQWKCGFPGCVSRSLFERGCDLRKHYKRHIKHLRCSFDRCPQSLGPSFSSNKDLARHEAKHAPRTRCEWKGCGKVFSRRDNMRDHMRRMHLNR